MIEKNQLRTLTQRKAYDLLYRKHRFADKQVPKQGVELETNQDMFPETSSVHEETDEPMLVEVPRLVKPVREPTGHYTLDDIKKYFHSPMRTASGYERIYGEDMLGVGLVLAISNNLNWAIEGASGSSKTLHMNKVLGLLYPHETMVVSQATENAMFGSDLTGINYVIFTELQKIGLNQKSAKGGRITELLKDWGEGRPAAISKSSGNQTIEYKLEPLPFAYTRATSNKYTCGAEFNRRIVKFYTDGSNHEEVTENKFADMHRILVPGHADANGLQGYIADVRSLDVLLFDPFSDNLMDIIPQKPETVAYVSHYLNMVAGSARFHFPERQKVDVSGNTYIIADIADHVNVFEAYYPHFCTTMGEEPKGQPDWSRWLIKGLEVMESPDAEVLRQIKPDVVDMLYRNNEVYDA